MAKFAIVAFLAAFLALTSAASFGGFKDIAGNYYDLSTGQYSSALTGKVYNTAPYAYAVPGVAPVVAAAPSTYVSGAVYPYSYGAPYPYVAPSAYVAPVWK